MNISTLNESFLYFFKYPLDSDQADLSLSLLKIRDLLYFPLHHVTFILYTLLYILTFYIKLKESFKWFLLNSIVLNLLTSGYNVFYYHLLSSKFDFMDRDVISFWIFYVYFNLLSYFSIFPTTLSRAILFYFPGFYHLYINTRNSIIFILTFNIIMFILMHFQFSFLSTAYVYFYYVILAASPGLSFIFSFLLTIKIRKSSNQLKKSFVNNSYKNLKRAFIYCLIQSLMEMVYFGLILYQSVVPQIALWKISIPNIVARIFIANAVLIDIVNVGFNMVESLMMIFLLKMYRNAVLDRFKWLKNLLKRTSVQPVGG